MTTHSAVSAKNSRRARWSWALWDWAEQPYPTIMQTFIFATYIVSAGFGDPAANTQALSIVGIVAGIAVALISPVLGRRSDENGRRKFWLLVQSGILISIMALSFFVEPNPAFLWFGLILYGLGSVVQETAFINYYAMLKSVVSPAKMGRLSGSAWGLGYAGGIILLLIALVGFYLGDNHWFGVTNEASMNIRIMFLLAAAWMLIFTIPMALFVPETVVKSKGPKQTIAQSYAGVWHQLKTLRAEAPATLRFLISSAIYRDGLAGVFTYGAILGAVAFGFEGTDVIFFGIAANVVAGIGAFVGGQLDDRIGTRAVISGSLIGLVIAGLCVFVFAGFGPITYWIGGLALCLFVGPAQASSRTFVARFTPHGREGEVFGLYQTTGRAASFLSPTAWLVSVTAATAAGVANPALYGILGLVLILGVGLVLLLQVDPNPKVLNDLEAELGMPETK